MKYYNKYGHLTKEGNKIDKVFLTVLRRLVKHKLREGVPAHVVREMLFRNSLFAVTFENLNYVTEQLAKKRKKKS